MLTFDLVGKLRQCNPLIYLINRGLEYEGIGLAGIWIKKRREVNVKGALLTKGAGRLREAAAGNIDQVLSNVPWPEVPEFEHLTENGKNIARKGWRSVVKDCVNKGAFSWSTAKKVFGSSLGEFDWDRLSYSGKEAALKRELEGKRWR